MNVFWLLSLYLHVTQSLKLADLIKKITNTLTISKVPNGIKFYILYNPSIDCIVKKVAMSEIRTVNSGFSHV